MTDADNTIYAGFIDEEPRVGGMIMTSLERGDDRNPVRTAADAEDGSGISTTQDIGCIVSGDDTPDRNAIEFLAAGRNEHPEQPFVLCPGKGGEEITP